MKAFLLAAGRGERLRPLTDSTPKCLVEVDGRPLLEIWFRILVGCGVDSVLVNTHHLAEEVEHFVREHPVAGLSVTLAHELRLLGSAGTVASQREFVLGEEAFFILYADNLADIDLRQFLAYHDQQGGSFTMGLFQSEEPEECGIATLDEDGRILRFEEKPKKPRSSLANSGLYIAGQEIFDLIPPLQVADFGFHVLPKLVGEMYGYEIPGYFCDLGTHARLERARNMWPDQADRAFLSEMGLC